VDPHGKRYALTTEAGEWLVGEIDGEVLFRAHHGLDGPLELFLLKRNLVLLGQHKGKRTVHIWVDGDQKFSRALPDRTCVFPGAGGKLRCAHSTARGLRVAGLSRSNVFSNAPSTQHKLYGSSAGVLGITEYGVVVWKEQGGQAESIGFLDACVGALSADGAWVGLGTVGGLVAIVSMASHQSRSEPNVIKSGALPFRDLAFSERDRWMATISDSIQLWTWEAGD